MTKPKKTHVWLARDPNGDYVVGKAESVFEIERDDDGNWDLDDYNQCYLCAHVLRRLVKSYPRNMRPGAKPRRVEIIIREVEE